jgi:predicted amidohydrolase YtcJ
MKRRTFVIVLILAGILHTAACTLHKSPAADTVLIHARIYTVNSKEPWAQAMAVREGKIIAVGSDKDIDAYRGPSTKVIDAKDHMVLPGFMDAHVHMMAGAAQLEQIALNDAKTIDDFQKMIKEYATAHPDRK